MLFFFFFNKLGFVTCDRQGGKMTKHYGIAPVETRR